MCEPEEKVHILIEAIKFIDQIQGVVKKLDRFDKIGIKVGNLYNNWSLKKIYSECKGIFPASNSDGDKFDNFIGLCLFLGAASKLTYKLANELAINPPFEKLPFTSCGNESHDSRGQSLCTTLPGHKDIPCQKAVG